MQMARLYIHHFGFLYTFVCTKRLCDVSHLILSCLSLFGCRGGGAARLPANESKTGQPVPAQHYVTPGFPRGISLSLMELTRLSSQF
jgi:hypothetical protein